MARINIEDCWWIDPRRSLLAKKIGSEELADGAFIRACKLAEDFRIENRGLVPIEIFKTIPYHKEIIDAKLAVVRPASEQDSNGISVTTVYVRREALWRA